MELLIIGGTRFLGRALVSAAQNQGHRVTMFNRGISNPELFPEVERLIGDRSKGLALPAGRHWDAVIDTCGYEPAVVQASAGQLADSAGLYTFVSSISAYADLSQPGIAEDAPLAALPEGEPETFKIENYGPLKALCERAAEQSMPGHVLNIRPGLIVGEYDASDRFTYWPWRVAQGGEVLAPGRPTHPIQFIDVRDLAEWIIRMVERNQAGTYNATGPDILMTMGDLLETSRRVSGSAARFTWVNEAFLLENGVEPWSDMPLWLPESDPAYAGMDRVDIRRALEAGLTFRSLEDTIASTLVWANSRPADHSWRAGITRAREAELLSKAREAGQAE